MDPDPGTDGGRQARLVAARDRVLTDHRESIAGVLAAATTVTEGWEALHATDRAAVVDPLSAELDRRGLGGPLLAALGDAVEAAGYALQADPVPAPPYLAMTSRGPVLRATVEDGRIVVSIDAFAIDRSGDGPRYVLREGGPEAAVSVALRGSRSVVAEGDPR